MGNQFETTVTSLSLDPSLRAVVLTGQGKSFSAGGDLKFLQDRASDNPISNAVTMRAFYRRFLPLRTLPVPVIAAVSGSAIGAGFAVALSCDMRLYAHDSKVGLTFTQLGLHPGMGSTHFLPSLIGHENVARLLLTGDVISGAEAVALGLGLCAAPPELLLPQAPDLARAQNCGDFVVGRQNVDAVSEDEERAWAEGCTAGDACLSFLVRLSLLQFCSRDNGGGGC